MIIKKFLIFNLVILNLTACSHSRPSRSEKKVENETKHFDLVDMAGKFKITREKGRRSKNNFFVREIFLPGDDQEKKVVESLTVVSELGNIKTKNNSFLLLRPQLAHHIVYLEGKKFESQMKINVKNKALDIMYGGEGEKFQKKSLKFPRGNSFCFFSQIVECLQLTNVLNSLEKHGEDVGHSLNVVWDGYPYFNQQYPVLPEEVFTKAKFYYDGETEDQMLKFKLVVGNEVIIYHLDRAYNFKKMFWVSQGLTQTSSD